ncbi:MAG: hypothetical protein K5985_05415 [Lachnospiraceae bacterium]|nr:hypothetical protein [Lachnospiraceae bacterium]
MERDLRNENEKAARASNDRQYREIFLGENEDHILRLTARLMKKVITKSDDEYSVALIAVSEALDGYDPEKGDFWGYASFVIKSRLYDMYRKEGRHRDEIAVSPDSFSGELEEGDPEAGMKLELREKLSDAEAEEENSLRYEIEAITEELEGFGISIFDIKKSPRTASTRKMCARVIKAVFLPPPLVALLRKTGLFPAKDVMERQDVSRKFIDKYRKYLIASTLILDGNYPFLAEYVKYLRS